MRRLPILETGIFALPISPGLAPRNRCQPVAIVISGWSKGDSPNIPSVYLISALLPTGNPWYLKTPSLFRESGICPTSGSRFRTIPWLLGQG